MYNLTLHIEYLLLHHDCVVVPGLGAFINVRLAAQMDAARGVWLPPAREVRFNSALNHDDGLLANSFARKNSVSFVEGRELLRHAVSALRETLASDGEVTLGRLGILRMEEDSLCFQPYLSPSQSAATLGYHPAPVKETDKVEYASADKVEYAGETLRTHGKDPDRYWYIPVNKSLTRAVACLLLAVVTALTMVIPSTRRTDIDKASVVPVDKIIETIQQTAKPAKTIDTSETVTADEAKTPEAETSAAEPVIETAQYHAIVATFRTEAEAREFVAMHHNSAYHLTVVNSRTWSRVSALRSADRNELQQAMSAPTFRAEFAEAWIWEE